jgi:hypothetical protein
MSYQCSICNKVHIDLPHIGAPAPYQWTSEFANDPSCLLTEDLCIIENRDFFVRGIIEIPVHDYEHEFGWGVWVSHKRENFQKYRDNFDSADIGPFFGWLSTEITFYSQSTLELKTMAHYRAQGLRPRIMLEPSEHPLWKHQKEGITFDEAWKMVHHYL